MESKTIRYLWLKRCLLLGAGMVLAACGGSGGGSSGSSGTGLGVPALVNAAVQKYAQDRAISTLTFVNTGGESLTACTVEGTGATATLPSGLTVAVSSDAKTCEISGTPDTPLAALTYTVKATNATGSDTATVSIEVVDPIRMLKNIHPSSSSNISADELTVFNNKVYFAADDGENGKELWVSDGTAEGTIMLKNIYDGSTGSNPEGFVVFNNKLYFSAHGTDGLGSLGVELWVSDGTAEGTALVKNINPGGNSSPKNLTVFNNKLYFSAYTFGQGRELWVSDGTIGNADIVGDINTKTVGGLPNTLDSNPENLTVFGNNLFFTADNGDIGVELWRIDTADNIHVVRDVSTAAPTEPGYTNASSNPRNLTVVGNTLYFSADGSLGNQLYNTKNSEIIIGGVSTFILSTNRVTGVSGGLNPLGLVGFNNSLYFYGADGSGVELWKSDGTEATTDIVKDINLGADDGILGLCFLEPVIYNNKMYFSGTDDGASGGLWSSDGTEIGTRVVVSFSIGKLPCEKVVFANKLYFTTLSLVTLSYEIWTSDGTASGTAKVEDIAEAFVDGVVLGNKLYFVGRDATHGTELWVIENID